MAIELLLGLRARATKDLDAAARLTGEEIGPRLRAALAHRWEGFAFRLTGLEQVRDTAALRGDVKVSYQGDPWSTVQFEVSPAEGASGQQIHWTANTFIDPEHLGLRSPGQLRPPGRDRRPGNRGTDRRGSPACLTGPLNRGPDTALARSRADRVRL